MKNLLIILLCTTALTLTSCGKYPKYEYAIEVKVPDSLKDKHQKMIVDLMSATSLHMTAGDYEDPEDVIQIAKWTADECLGVPTEGLNIRESYGDYSKWKSVDLLTPQELRIFKQLKLQQLRKIDMYLFPPKPIKETNRK